MLGKIEGRRRRGWQRTRWLEWDHWFNGPEFEQALGDGEGQGILACCSPWGHKELGMTERLNNNNTMSLYLFQLVSSLVRQAGFPKVWYNGRMRNKTQEFSERRGSGDQHRSKVKVPNWIHASFIILSAMKERMCRELSYNSCGLQGQRTKWSLAIK